MSRLNFGAFLAPHHPIGEHPMLQFRRDLDLVEQLDKLGYDEFWCGEHHSSGWEMIASPEMFLAAAGERTKRIKLATGVVSLPYHHPFNVAQRMVQLDYMTGGRAIFGSGPGALASDAHTLGVDPMVLRDRQDEAIGIIRRLFKGERVTATLQRPGARPFKTPDQAVDRTAFSDAAAATIGTPDDLVQRIKSVIDISGGFGTVVGFVHDWANPENTARSWDMVARYVVPEINGYLAGLRKSQDFVANNRAVFDRGREAVMAKINENEAASAALTLTKSSMLSASASNMPDLDKAKRTAAE
jgi:alkanesulfonate monooxygenase SsuD/methylene tetrahydromethanopterin reductase-like flavin-dependent oxidoreductase (luciferase family)